MILVGGENLIDFIQVPGADGEKPCYRANPGGSPYNVAKALGRQLAGTDTAVGYLTPVSTDTLGELLAEGLKGSGAELRVARSPRPTSLAVVSLQEGVPSYQFYRENTAERGVTLDILQEATPGNVVGLLLGSLALTHGADADVWAEYYCKQKTAGVVTMLDPNIRAAFIVDRPSYMARLKTVLEHTDLLKLSDEDLQWLSPDEPDLEKSAAALLHMSSAAFVVVTLGSKGAFALFRTGEEKVSVKAAPVTQLRDTVGAGDTFAATMLATLASSGRLTAAAIAGIGAAELETLLSRASHAAAINCGREGCDPPSSKELDAAVSG